MSQNRKNRQRRLEDETRNVFETGCLPQGTLQVQTETSEAILELSERETTALRNYFKQAMRGSALV